MKLVSKSFAPGSGEPGAVKLIPEEAEDMWHLYNLIAAGDRVQATTIRKVSFDTGGAGGGSESERVKLKLTLLVEAVEYDASAAELRVRGRNMTETEFVKMGGALRPLSRCAYAKKDNSRACAALCTYRAR
jgi:protein pelota